jgi:type II secretory pathway component PulK
VSGRQSAVSGLRVACCPRRGVVLAVVLITIGLLSLVMVSYLFFIRSELAGILAHGDGQQARLAAESGLEEIVAALREEPHNAKAWYDQPTRFRHALIWGERFDRESDPVREAASRIEALDREAVRAPAWRFAAVAARLDGPERTMRFGVTPESSKLNLNTASDPQIADLITPLLLDLGIETPDGLVNALLDWRDQDSDTRDGGAEDEYYNNLEPGPAYATKNAPFDTVEELLLVKGFNAAILYGEDVNRNGMLDKNEDDGDESFPYYDNGDGILNHGIAPFLTVFARETDSALDNQQRINLNADAAVVAAQIAQYFEEGELSPQTVAFINELKQQNFDFTSIASPADLYAGEPEGGEGDPNAPQADPKLAASLITLEEMPVIMDYFTTRPAQSAGQPIDGLININTAPSRVLARIPSINPETVEAIIANRGALDAEQTRTTAWPLTSGAVSPSLFKQIAPYITTKAYQFHVEVIGYADHRKMFKRLEWIVEMVGPLPQIKYYRDLTRLGFAWPIDDESVVLINP